jgi:hypothetical protein
MVLRLQIPRNPSIHCWDVTGTWKDTSTDPPRTGTITGRIDGNQLTGSYSIGCVVDQSSDGKFYLTMTADNRSWIGKMISTHNIQIDW